MKKGKTNYLCLFCVLCLVISITPVSASLTDFGTENPTNQPVEKNTNSQLNSGSLNGFGTEIENTTTPREENENNTSSGLKTYETNTNQTNKDTSALNETLKNNNNLSNFGSTQEDNTNTDLIIYLDELPVQNLTITDINQLQIGDIIQVLIENQNRLVLIKNISEGIFTLFDGKKTFDWNSTQLASHYQNMTYRPETNQTIDEELINDFLDDNNDPTNNETNHNENWWSQTKDWCKQHKTALIITAAVITAVIAITIVAAIIYKFWPHETSQIDEGWLDDYIKELTNENQKNNAYKNVAGNVVVDDLSQTADQLITDFGIDFRGEKYVVGTKIGPISEFGNYRFMNGHMEIEPNSNSRTLEGTIKGFSLPFLADEEGMYSFDGAVFSF
jgi:hypothetical protein